MGLQRKIKPKKRLPSLVTIPLAVSNRPNVCRSIVFMSDTLITGKKIRAFNVIDDFNREVLWIATDTSMPADRVIHVLDLVAAIHGYPEKLEVTMVQNLFLIRFVIGRFNIRLLGFLFNLENLLKILILNV